MARKADLLETHPALLGVGREVGEWKAVGSAGPEKHPSATTQWSTQVDIEQIMSTVGTIN